MRWSRTLSIRMLLTTAGLLLTSGLINTGLASPAATHEPVEIQFEAASPYYQPPVAIVPAGTPVRWINSTATHHSVRHDSCAVGMPCAFQSIAVPPDSAFVIGPLPPGRYSYHCALHPIMRGTLLVVKPVAEGEAIASAMEPAKPAR